MANIEANEAFGSTLWRDGWTDIARRDRTAGAL